MSKPSSMGDLTAEWTAVTTLDDLWEGDVLEVTVGTDVILLAHLPGGVVRAYQGICPHAEFPLEDGELEDSVLTCAGHAWEFDLATGKGVNPPDCQLYAYPVRVDGDQVSVAVPSDGRPHYNRCRQ
jgi:toluene monooxygenase system ferredoxin subunit